MQIPELISLAERESSYPVEVDSLFLLSVSLPSPPSVLGLCLSPANLLHAHSSYTPYWYVPFHQQVDIWQIHCVFPSMLYICLQISSHISPIHIRSEIRHACKLIWSQANTLGKLTCKHTCYKKYIINLTSLFFVKRHFFILTSHAFSSII